MHWRGGGRRRGLLVPPPPCHPSEHAPRYKTGGARWDDDVWRMMCDNDDDDDDDNRNDHDDGICINVCAGCVCACHRTE